MPELMKEQVWVRQLRPIPRFHDHDDARQMTRGSANCRASADVRERTSLTSNKVETPSRQ
jgi:hypothetical protein